MKKVYLFLLLCVCIQLSWGQDRATEIRNTFLSGNTSQLLVVAHRADWRNVFRIGLTWGFICCKYILTKQWTGFLAFCMIN